MMRPPRRSTLFPYTPLFRSALGLGVDRPLAGGDAVDEVRDLRGERVDFGKAPVPPAAVDGLHTQPLPAAAQRAVGAEDRDRKSTRLNSSHLVISYAVFCLKK